MIKMALLDWRAMKYYHLRMIFIPVLALLAGYVAPLFVVPVSVYACLFFSVNAFAVEEKGDLNRLYLTLPVERSAVVAGRYMLSFGMVLAGLIIGIPLTFAAERFTRCHYGEPQEWLFPVAAGSCLLYALCNLFMFPVLFCRGYSRGKFFALFLPVLVFGMLYAEGMVALYWPGNERLLFEVFRYARENALEVIGGMIAAAAGFLCISCLLSKALYVRREF